MQITWIYRSFEELTTTELYAILELRSRVFVVEQNCIYQDVDGKDQLSFHLMCRVDDVLAGYTRMIPQGISYAEASIGRVVTSPDHRQLKLGRELMERSIDKAFEQFGCTSIKISAQVYLLQFYESLGFVKCGDEYLDDGIPHIEMLLQK